jgi:ring-1,2-phenylacetyl-CoA epoxidase subunit PaaD
VVKEMGSDPFFEETIERAWSVLATVADPEIPVISVVDLGIVRGIAVTDVGVEVSVTPTYAGCPATHVIESDILEALTRAGIVARMVTRLSPPWTTDWITPAGHARLKEFGIAPPAPAGSRDGQVIHLVPRGANLQQVPACPHCGAANTELLSQFGSTACKALYRCLDCREPFDYFKPL